MFKDDRPTEGQFVISLQSDSHSPNIFDVIGCLTSNADQSLEQED